MVPARMVEGGLEGATRIVPSEVIANGVRRVMAEQLDPAGPTQTNSRRGATAPPIPAGAPRAARL